MSIRRFSQVKRCNRLFSTVPTTPDSTVPPTPVYSGPPVQPKNDGLTMNEKNAKFVQRAKSPQPLTFTEYLSDGKELYHPKDSSEIRVLTGMPREYSSQQVIIAPRVTNTTHSGKATAHQWEITWPKDLGGNVYANPLMGWASTANAHKSLVLQFNNKESAIGHAKKQGWAFTVRPDAELRVTSQEPGWSRYEYGFLPKKLRDQIKEEGPGKCQEFANPDWGNSHWFQPLTYHGDKEVRQHGVQNPSH